MAGFGAGTAASALMASVSAFSSLTSAALALASAAAFHSNETKHN
jgi:hypothetical protein